MIIGILGLSNETIPLILERDGIDEDTFWQRLPEYAAKRELSDDDILALQETYEEQHGTGDESEVLSNCEISFLFAKTLWNVPLDYNYVDSAMIKYIELCYKMRKTRYVTCKT